MLLMKKNKYKTFVVTLFILSLSFVFASQRYSFYTTIQTIIDTEKVYDLPVYMVKGYSEKYILLKDLAKILSATLTYYSSAGCVSFNCRGEKIYFYFNKNYFVTSKQRVYLGSEVINIKNRTFVPVSILNNSNFMSLFNFGIEYQKEKNLLIINTLDSVNVSYYVTKDDAKIELRFPQDTHFEYDVNSDGIFVSFFSAKTRLKEYKIEGGVVSKIVLYPRNSNTFCNILFADKNVKIKKEEYKNKLVFYIEKEETQKVILSSTETLIPVVAVKNNNTKIANNKNTNKTIVIDPGHGGEDPGAIGKYGNKEKEINLAIAKLLKQKLEDEGFTVYLTREEDIFIPLVKRTEFANSKNADLFISIHCNATENPLTTTDHGFEIYFLSEKATDPTAVATEKLENEVVRFEKQTEEITKLQKILWSMIVNEFINESSKLCSLIGNETVQRTKQYYRGVKQAGFYVLRGAQMPAVLVEVGFISNPQEELKLTRKDFQELIADGICAGIKKYYEEQKR